MTIMHAHHSCVGNTVMLTGAGKKHTVSHDEKSGATSVSHLESVSCGDPAAVKTLLERAARVRTVGATAANDRSSRSHMVFLLSIHGSNAATGQQLNGACPVTCVLTSNIVPSGYKIQQYASLAPPWIISPVCIPLEMDCMRSFSLYMPQVSANPPWPLSQRVVVPAERPAGICNAHHGGLMAL